ncbi:uncharacterized protein LOC131672233 isoform X3 [Phymastichus coffea]|uniref:uncharacterized protein LOC131672233 isoform X3 n=1 Tax=Phymastichus coffea TaxID=108790 RepID=UPI00273B5E1C|nr:uncharacterized protein LOC131672233 isoform X3 [Phymastichus coffea]
MDIFDGYYYKSCKRFMSLCGLWPEQNNKSRYLRLIVFVIFNASLAVPQFGKDMAITFENSVSVMFALGVFAKYLVAFVNKKRLSSLLVTIAKDWQTVTDRKEREILTKNTAQGRLLLIIYTYYIHGAWVLYTLMPFLPLALDYMLPLNDSRPVLMPFYANYLFFEQSDYHYWACGHIAVSYLAPLVLFCGLDTIYVISVKHTCGLFEIVCRRLETLLKSEKGQQLSKLPDNPDLVMKLSETIQLHNDTIGCCDLLENSFNLCFLMVNCMSVVTIALTCVYILFVYSDLFKLIRIVAFLVGLIMHLLYLNWVGQQIINSSEQVFISAYFSDWYLIPNSTKKFINIIMIRSLVPCTLTSGKLANLSMENFGIVIHIYDISYIYNDKWILCWK